jgi:hypothetical protein
MKKYKITSITKLNERPVYDIINVKNNNNYIGSNFLLHNSSSDWARRENKDLKKKLAQVRTKHMLYILCFPLKITKLEKNYLESFTNYWVDLFGRGRGAIYVKNQNPVADVWMLKAFEKIGSYNEFTPVHTILDKLKRHPNFWMSIKFPRPPEWLYNRYLVAREQNVYDDENVIASTSKEDVYKALLVLSLRDIMQHDNTLSINRILLHIKNEYDIPLTKQMIEEAIDDSKQLVVALREKFNMSLADLKDK